MWNLSRTRERHPSISGQCETKGSALGFKITLKPAHFLHSLYALKLYSIFSWGVYVQRSERSSWNWPGYSLTSPLHV